MQVTLTALARRAPLSAHGWNRRSRADANPSGRERRCRALTTDLTKRVAFIVSRVAVELETRTQAFAIERDALALAAAESTACIKALQGAAAAAEAQIAQQTRELQETKARQSHPCLRKPYINATLQAEAASATSRAAALEERLRVVETRAAAAAAVSAGVR